MDQAEEIQPSAASSPRGRRDDWRASSSVAYRVLVPASPVILALGFGLYVPKVLSLENIVNISSRPHSSLCLLPRRPSCC